MLPQQTFADDAAIQKGLDQANGLYAQRSATNPQPIDQAIQLLQSLEGQADDSDLDYDILILESKAFYWKGFHTNTNNDKMAIFLQGRAKAEAAKSVNDGYAEAYYFAGINLGRWAEANGVLASLGKKGELEDYLNQSINHLTREGQSGETLDGYGPDRAFGLMYYKLPSLLGGSLDTSKSYLEKAYKNAPSFAINVVYYAQTLNAMGDAAGAKKILDDLLSKNPQTLNASRVPETLDELQLARDLRSKIE